MNLPDVLSQHLDRTYSAMARRDRAALAATLARLDRLIAPDPEIRQALAGSGLLCERAMDGTGPDAWPAAERAIKRLSLLLRFANPSRDAENEGFVWKPVCVA